MYFASNDLALVFDGRPDARLEAWPVCLADSRRTLQRHHFFAHCDPFYRLQATVAHSHLRAPGNAVRVAHVQFMAVGLSTMAKLEAVPGAEVEGVVALYPLHLWVQAREDAARSSDSVREHREDAT